MAGVNVIQQGNICKGVVKDETGESIIGASVLVKGTTNGTITDIDGNFTLSNLKKGDVIEVSYIGYKSQEIVWNGQAINIVLKLILRILKRLLLLDLVLKRKKI